MICDGNPMEYGWTAKDGTRWYHPPYGPVEPMPCRPYVCNYPPPRHHHPCDRWTCPTCGTTYRLSRPVPRRWWRRWYAPHGHWTAVR